MQRLLVMQSMWAMQRLGGDGPESTLEQKVRMIAEGGFDGAGLRVEDRAFVSAAVCLLHAAGLAWQGVCIVRSLQGLRHAVALAGEFQAHHLDVQADLGTCDLSACAEFVEASLRIARAAGVRIHFETHRHRITADLARTLDLLERVPGLELTADLSHYVLAHEFTCPPSAEDQAMVFALLQRCSAFHGRVGSRGQIQLPLGFAHLQHWVELFMGWWQEGLQSWRRRSAPDATLAFLCELGPPEYAITDRDGRELSDRWLEALELKDRVRELWARAGDRAAGTLRASLPNPDTTKETP